MDYFQQTPSGQLDSIEESPEEGTNTEEKVKNIILYKNIVFLYQRLNFIFKFKQAFQA